MINFSKYFFLIMFFTGCAQMQIASRTKTIHNEACLESPRIKVFQVLNDGILAHLCPVDYPSFYEDAFEACVVKGDLVYMAVPPKANDFVDNQKVTLSQNECFVGDGTYSYTRSDGFRATVRNIKILKEELTPAAQ